MPLGGPPRQAVAEPKAGTRSRTGDGYFTYSNLSFPIVASVMEMATGERFDRLMDRLVMDPMGRRLLQLDDLRRLGPAAGGRADAGRQSVRDDLGGKRPDLSGVREGRRCDLARWRLGGNGALFSPQGGLRISVRDLARVGPLLLNAGTIDDARIRDRTRSRRWDACLVVRRLRTARGPARPIASSLWAGHAVCSRARSVRRRSVRQGTPPPQP